MSRRAVSAGWRLAAGLVLALATLAVFALLPAKAQAHPLGNFTINHYSELEFAEDEAHVTYVLDLAEIPTVQEKSRLDTDGDGELSEEEAEAYLDAELPALVEDLRLEVGGEALPLEVLDRSAEFVPGEAGLPTLRIQAHLLADLPEGWEDDGSGYYTNLNHEERLGWREVVVRGGPGVAVEDSTAPTAGISDELRSYPEEMLATPLEHHEAEFTLVPGDGTAASDTAGPAAERVEAQDIGGAVTDRVSSLVSVDSFSPAVIGISLLAAFFWGAAHTLTPGHGKAIVAAYLVGSRGTARHAAFLGLTVTLTHTLGVFALGAVTLYLSRYLLPEVLYPWLSVASGLLVVAIGLALLYRRLPRASGSGRKAQHAPVEPADGDHAHSHGAHGGHEHPHVHVHAGHAHPHDDHEHSHAHGDHQSSAREAGHETHTHSHSDSPDDERHSHHSPGYGHSHGHSHLPPGADGSEVTLRSLLALGVTGGLVPCPAALILLLSAISLGRLEFGMVLVVAFSVGLAVVLTGIGLLMIYARQLFKRFSFEARVPGFLPAASALTISVVGVFIVIGALGQTGIF